MDDHLWTPWRMSYLTNGAAGASGDCVFCKMIHSDDDVAHHMLQRGEHCFVTLNLYPYNNGHMMIVPYRHVGALDALGDETLTEMMTLARHGMRVLRLAFNPDGFNLGINQGSAAGAGIAEHLHLHVVPRWGGDSSFMSVIGGTRVIPEWIDDTYKRLAPLWDDPAASPVEGEADEPAESA
jgi:ATP adenylyltransferase